MNPRVEELELSALPRESWNGEFVRRILPERANGSLEARPNCEPVSLPLKRCILRSLDPPAEPDP
jgi:hypothetical protein